MTSESWCCLALVKFRITGFVYLPGQKEVEHHVQELWVWLYCWQNSLAEKAKILKLQAVSARLSSWSPLADILPSLLFSSRKHLFTFDACCWATEDNLFSILLSHAAISVFSFVLWVYSVVYSLTLWLFCIYLLVSLWPLPSRVCHVHIIHVEVSSWFSPSAMWILGTELSLVAEALAHWAISPTLFNILKRLLDPLILRGTSLIRVFKTMVSFEGWKCSIIICTSLSVTSFVREHHGKIGGGQWLHRVNVLFQPDDEINSHRFSLLARFTIDTMW